MSSELSPAVPNLIKAGTPAEVMQQSSEVASVLTDMLRKQKLTMSIRGREHVLVEGWTALGNLLGVYPVVEWSRPLVRDDAVYGWEARVEARTLNGSVVGAAESQCTRDEKIWQHREEYALRSMAQTRATSKALRLPLGFIVSLAGYEVTPAEEMPTDMPTEAEAVRAATAATPEPEQPDVDEVSTAWALLYDAAETRQPEKLKKDDMFELVASVYRAVQVTELPVDIPSIIQEVTDLAGDRVEKWGEIRNQPTRVVVLTAILNELKQALSEYADPQ